MFYCWVKQQYSKSRSLSSIITYKYNQNTVIKHRLVPYIYLNGKVKTMTIQKFTLLKEKGHPPPGIRVHLNKYLLIRLNILLEHPPYLIIFF